MITETLKSKIHLSGLLYQQYDCLGWPKETATRTLDDQLVRNDRGVDHKVSRTIDRNIEGKTEVRKTATVDIVGLIHNARSQFKFLPSDSPANEIGDQLFTPFRYSSLDVFVEGVSHHFNNLFMSIQGYLSLLLRDIDPNHAGSGHLLRIEKLIHGESILTNDLLRFLIGRPCRISSQDQDRLLQEIRKVASFVGSASGVRPMTTGTLSISSSPEQILRNLSVSVACILGQLLTEIREQATRFYPHAEVEKQTLQRLQKILKLVQLGLRPVCQLLGYAGHTAFPNGHRVSRSGLVEAMQKTVAHRDKNLHLFMDVSGDLPQIKLQQRQLSEILQAVVDNAAEAMSPGGHLNFEAVELRPEQIDEPGWHVPAKHFIRLTCSDSGRGFDPSFGRLIFDPFFTNKGRIGHCGLGLSNIYGMVNTLGGYISVETVPGHGTDMHIYLPSETSGNPGRDHLAYPQCMLPTNSSPLGQSPTR